jgi:hypothetical protein
MNTPPNAGGRTDTRPISEDIVRRVTDARRAEAELGMSATWLRSTPPGGGQDSSAATAERRKELLRIVERNSVPADAAARRRDELVVSIGSQLYPWQVLYLPYMYEGINETPGISGTSGEVGTAGLYAGGLGFGCLCEDDGTTDPYTQKFWIHNWYNSAVLPPAPAAGRMYYRFTVDSDLEYFTAPVDSGSLGLFVTIGWTANVAEDPGLSDWTTWQTVGWPINEPLPTDNPSYGGSVSVLGSIPVDQGNSAAVGFIYGVIVSAASGLVRVIGDFGTRLTYPPAGEDDYLAYDKMEYRFEPTWWIEAIENRVSGLQLR